MHVFLYENSMAAQLNERRLKKNQYVYAIRVNSSVRNCWGLFVDLRLKQSTGFIQRTVALLQAIPAYAPEISVHWERGQCKEQMDRAKVLALYSQI